MLYESNLELLRKRDPVLADLVDSSDDSGLDIASTRQGGENLVDKRVMPFRYFHSSYCPEKEALKLLDEIDYATSEVLFSYGLGLAYFYDPMEPWLEEREHYLVFLEDDLAVIKAFLRSKRAARLLKSPGAYIVYMGETAETREKVCEEMLHYFVKLSFKFSALPLYMKAKEEIFWELRSKISHYGAFANYASVEMLIYGVTYFQNFYKNFVGIERIYETAEFIESQPFKGVPAVICGAGPSLNKNLDFLASLDQKALFFAGGSALTALSNTGIAPHFGASADPNPEQFERMADQSGFEVPIFYKARVFHRSLLCLHGPKLYLGGSSTYPITSWLEKELGINAGPQLQEGYNIIHLITDLAVRLGCDPIIFVGMDLAFTGMQTYASNVLPDEKTDVSKESITAQSNLNNNAFPRKGAYGENVYTLWKWVAESNYLGKYAKEHPEVTMVNATEGGLGIPGIEHITLKEAADKYLINSWDLRAWERAQIESTPCHSPRKGAVKKVFEDLNESIKRAYYVCDDVEKLINQLLPELKKQKHTKAQKLIDQIKEKNKELNEEVAYKYILEPVGRVRTRMLNRELDRYKLEEGFSELGQLLHNWKVNQKQLQFYKETSQVNKLYLSEAFSMLKR